MQTKIESAHWLYSSCYKALALKPHQIYPDIVTVFVQFHVANKAAYAACFAFKQFWLHKIQVPLLAPWKRSDNAALILRDPCFCMLLPIQNSTFGKLLLLHSRVTSSDYE